jgi:hypothetical protein
MRWMIFLALLGLLNLMACTAIVNATLENHDAATDDASDGEVSEEADVGPDFDTDACGVWGRVHVPDTAAVNIIPEDAALDGQGFIRYTLYSATAGLWSGYEEQNVDLAEDHFYCIPAELVAGLGESFLLPVFFEDTLDVIPNQMYDFRTVVTDPLNIVVADLYIKRHFSTYLTYSDVYWDGTQGKRVDLSMEYRVSRYTATLRFDDSFASLPRAGTDARVCAVAFTSTGIGDPLVGTTFIASAYADIPDAAVVAGNTVRASMNIAARPDQVFEILLVYVENRIQIVSPDRDACEGTRRTCTTRCSALAAQDIGREFSDPEAITIMPPGSGCDIPTEFSCPTL